MKSVDTTRLKVVEVVFKYAKYHVYRVATDFAILDVRLAAGRQIQQHGNLFPTIGTHKTMFEGYIAHVDLAVTISMSSPHIAPRPRAMQRRL